MDRKEANPPPPPAPTKPPPLGRPTAATSAAGEANHTGTTTTSSSSSSSSSPSDFLRQTRAALKRHRTLAPALSNVSRPRRVLASSKDAASVPSISVAATGNASSQTSEPLNAVASSDQNKKGLISGGGEGAETTPPLPPQEEALVTPPSTTETLTLQRGVESELVADGQNAFLISHDAQKKVQFCMAAGNSRSACQKEEGSLGAAMHEPDQKQPDSQRADLSDIRMKFGDAHLSEKSAELRHSQHFVDPMTQGSVAGSSCALAGQTAIPTQMSSNALKKSLGIQDNAISESQGMAKKVGDQVEDYADASHFDEKIKGKAVSGPGVSQSQVPPVKDSSSNVELEPSQSTRAEKVPRKKKYDSDSFFKVNGKLYQKLGKIGSGGSSEVHKVITSDCTIYALKKIKLKGRDYPTAYGFCQEIEYLNKLKGKNNIIQLTDYEVTDRTLLEDVMSGCMTIKDGRIKDDVYIYMVLEYGEIDLAHMLSQKWREVDSASWKIDDNWLRFYWQQMLEAVNTIHEVRIVHSDLKPANFLLVKGSLKLIDFGIAKAISSETTNIQRDSQVGTLNYMSPEAFMYSEHDPNGNTIKCGRPSDIWSLGCILYQMVYGKTPFAESKTFWAKYKSITDRNHKISYEPLSNPWLVDLMKKCLAWDRNERWRIPQLLRHPFLLPPMPPQELPPSCDHTWKSLLQRVEVHRNVPQMSRLLNQFQELFAQMSRLLSQIQELFAQLEEGSTDPYQQI